MNDTRQMSLKNQYSLVQALYYVSNCVIIGFAAVYLQHKGLTNVQIGVITGSSAFLTLIVQPLITQLAEGIRCLSLKRVIVILMVFMAVLWAILSIIPITVFITSALYLILYTINCCIPALLNAMGMEYINQNRELDFSFSRGLGSFAYAFGAVLLGVVSEHLSPDVLGYIFIGTVVLFLIFFLQMEDLNVEQVEVPDPSADKENSGIVTSILKNPEFICVTIVFFVVNMCNWGTLTYLINIIRNLGGADTALGVAYFVGTSSEVPVMLLLGWMMKKWDSKTLLKVSGLFYVMQPLAFLVSWNLTVLVISMALQGLCYGLFTAVSVYYVNEVMPPKERVKGQSVFYMITAGAAIGIGNLLSGWMLDISGPKEMLAVYTGISAVSFIFLLAGMKTENRNSEVASDE